MPADFNRCVKDGGRVRTLPNKHLVCFPKGGGKGIVGEKRTDMNSRISNPRVPRRTIAAELLAKSDAEENENA